MKARYIVSLLLSLTVVSSGLAAELSRGENEPVFISSDKLRLDMNNRIFTYTGNVEVLSGELHLFGDSLTGNYDENNQIQEMTARGSVAIQNGPGTFAQANQADFNQSQQSIVLSKDPSITQEGNVLSADEITLYLEDNRTEAKGQVRVKLAETEQKP